MTCWIPVPPQTLHSVSYTHLFRFSGESGDEGGADGDARNGFPDLPEQGADIVSVRDALHGVQHVIGNVLEGDVYIAGHFGAFRDGCGQFVAPVGGLGVEQPDPEFPLNGVQGAEQGGLGLSAGCLLYTSRCV